MKFLWLTGFLGLLDFLAAVKLEDPELTKSIQALFDEEARPDHRIAEQLEDVPKLHTKLVDPFDDESSVEKDVKDMKEGSEADPFAELEALKPKPIPVTATKVALPKVDAALSGLVSRTEPHTDATVAVAAVAKPVKDVKDVVVKAVSAEPSSKPDDKILKQPEPRLAKEFVAVNKSEQTLLKASVSFAKNDVVKVNDMGTKARALSKTRHDQNKTETVAAKQVPSRTVRSTEPAKLEKEKEIKEVKEIKSGTFLHARAPATPAEVVNPPSLQATVAQQEPSDVGTAKTWKAPKAPSSLAAFWTQEVPTVSKEKAVADVHPQLALIQHVQLHRGVDFTQSPETSDSEPEISISEPFKALEQEDQRETQHLRDLDRHLRVKARSKVSEATFPAVKFLGTTGSTGSSRGASTASTWEKLEAEDQKIEDKILVLDDPRRPADLRQYQQLNNMQDESMAELESLGGEAKMRR